MIFRSRLCAEPDRDWLYCWARSGDLSLSFDGQPVERFSATFHEEKYDANYHGGVMLPLVKTGTYKLGFGPEVVPVVVERPPKRKDVTILPGKSADNLAAAIKSGKREITLAPGEHVFTRSVTLPDDTLIRGYGATVRASSAIAPIGDKRPAFVPGNNVSVYGVTFTHEDPTDHIFYGRNADNVFPLGLVLADCTFKRCSLGFYFREVLVRDTRFESAGVTIAPGGLWLRCTFTGLMPQPAHHAWSYWAGLGPVAMVDCTFDGTDRGPVFRAGSGAIDSPLFVGLRCSNISQTPNGNEILLCEGETGSFDRAIILHTRINGCQSMFAQMDCQSSGCLVRDILIDDGGGFCLWGPSPNWKVTSWDVSDFELRNGAGIYCGANATDNEFRDGSIINWQPGRVNQTFQNQSPIGYKRTLAAWSEGVGNRLTRVALMNSTMRGFDVIG